MDLAIFTTFDLRNQKFIKISDIYVLYIVSVHYVLRSSYKNCDNIPSKQD